MQTEPTLTFATGDRLAQQFEKAGELIARQNRLEAVRKLLTSTRRDHPNYREWLSLIDKLCARTQADLDSLFYRIDLGV